MPENRWDQIDALLGEALERPPDERTAFLRAACGHDSDLYGAVDALLASEHAAATRLGESATTFAAALLDDAFDAAVGRDVQALDACVVRRDDERGRVAARAEERPTLEQVAVGREPQRQPLDDAAWALGDEVEPPHLLVVQDLFRGAGGRAHPSDEPG